jgi:anti-sigma factor RsiW
MTCQELVELVTDFLEDRLDDDDRRRFDEHLDVCPDCREYVEQTRVTIHGLGRLPQDTLSPAASDALLQAFQAWRGAGS